MQSWTLEEEEKLRKLYNQGYTYDYIGIKLDRSFDSVKKHIYNMKKMGKLTDRKTHVTLKREESIAKVKDDLVRNVIPVKMIAEKYDMSIQSVYDYRRELIKRGEKIETPKFEVIRKKKTKAKKPMQTLTQHSFARRNYGKIEFATPTLPNGKPVHCTLAISQKCVYGVESGGSASGLCRFSQCTGKCRSVNFGEFEGCDPTACTRFSRVSADNPKRKVIEQ